jgi:hypothetical protein
METYDENTMMMLCAGCVLPAFKENACKECMSRAIILQKDKDDE